MLKSDKTGNPGKYVFVVFNILFALVVRITLIVAGWPPIDSDEGLIGLQAMHIAYQGEHPIFLYGQNYMGTIEPYLASIFFRFLGISPFTLRLSTLLLYGLFLLFMYMFTRLLYTRALALVVVGLLSLGTPIMLTPQIMVEGGVVESLMCGSLLMLLSSWLVLTTGESISCLGGPWRPILYACWGLVAGVALWSDYLICPWLLTASLVLLIFCWREWRTTTPLCLLTGFIVGALPIIIYNVHPDSGQNFFQVIWGLQHSTVAGTTVDWFVRLKEFIGTFLYGLPMMSGLAPLCGLSNLPFFGSVNVDTVMCVVLNGSWGLGYVALLVLAMLLSWRALRNLHSLPAAWSLKKKRFVALHASRLMLLFAPAITIVLYALSPISGQRPWSTRYLACLLIATPAILWPLWRGMSDENAFLKHLPFGLFNVLRLLRHGLVVLIILSSLAATAMTFLAAPSAAVIDQNEYRLISDLLTIHVTHVYSEYWTCGRMMFQSQEKIICAVVNEHMEVNHNRYEAYAKTVAADPLAAYIFSTDSVYAPYVKNCIQKLAASQLHYQRYDFDGYIVFVPS